MDDQKISPMEELAQGFTAVTLVMVDKPPDQPLERPKTPRAFADKDRECYYVTTDYGSSEDERDGAKPPEHRMPREAQHNSAAAFVAPPLTCDEESLCTKSRRKTNETFVQTISTGVPGRDLDLKVMFDAKPNVGEELIIFSDKELADIFKRVSEEVMAEQGTRPL
jgi:hypothetical protein